jgi:hypothetical protein
MFKYLGATIMIPLKILRTAPHTKHKKKAHELIIWAMKLTLPQRKKKIYSGMHGMKMSLTPFKVWCKLRIKIRNYSH